MNAKCCKCNFCVIMPRFMAMFGGRYVVSVRRASERRRGVSRRSFCLMIVVVVDLVDNVVALVVGSNDDDCGDNIGLVVVEVV